MTHFQALNLLILWVRVSHVAVFSQSNFLFVINMLHLKIFKENENVYRMVHINLVFTNKNAKNPYFDRW